MKHLFLFPTLLFTCAAGFASAEELAPDLVKDKAAFEQAAAGEITSGTKRLTMDFKPDKN